MKRTMILVLMLAGMFALTRCGDDKPVGACCLENNECETGFCMCTCGGTAAGICGTVDTICPGLCGSDECPPE